MLCSQTTDSSIDLYWDQGRLRSRHGTGAAPAVHIPVVEKCVGRLAASTRSCRAGPSCPPALQASCASTARQSDIIPEYPY